MSAGNRHSYKAGVRESLIRVFGFLVAENVTKLPRLKQMLEAPAEETLRGFLFGCATWRRVGKG